MREILSEIKILAPVINNIITFLNTLLRRGKKININKHPIFVRTSVLKTSITLYFKLQNKGKELAFKDILSKHMDIYFQYAKDLCEKYTTNLIDDSETLYIEATKALDNIINDLSTFYIMDNRYTAQEKEVLKKVIEKYNTWDQTRRNEISNRMLEICNSVFYPDLNYKIIAILDTFIFVMNDTVCDSSATLNILNGDLKGLFFKGVEI